MSETDPPPPAQPPLIDYQTPVGADDAWISIYTCKNREEADLAVAKLQAHGLHARVDGQESFVFGQSWAGGASPISPKIHVLRGDAAEARAILDEVEQRRRARLSVACPKCGQVDVNRVWPRPRLVAMALVAASFLSISVFERAFAWVCPFSALAMCAVMWPYTPRWRCNKCDHRWIAPDPELSDHDEDDDEDEA